eukprot:TRINITY_DN12760_c0_g3_i1.p1 TRINITY_DN12760_c0_g3~~TRINITY_DN12760_c0_g3_i1.p1  ORF type:complete len:359 (+),score=85.10 TRINITY_DN12760_c0_g3_i1:48-1124(+)
MLNFFRSEKTILTRRYEGRTAVITGAGSGMGREMAILLCKSGLKGLAICDISTEAMEETKQLCLKENKTTHITCDVVDVSSKQQMSDWAKKYKSEHGDKVNLLVANAGIVGENNFLTEESEFSKWDKVFEVDFYGVVNTMRYFLDLVTATTPEEGAGIVTISSMNGFWACLGPDSPNNPYVSAKFAVRGFTESLMNQLRVSHPHVVVSSVHPGHIGTNILIKGKDAITLDGDWKGKLKKVKYIFNLPECETAEEAKEALGKAFKEQAPLTAANAAAIIIGGAARGNTRILVGADAYFYDYSVRLFPRFCYSMLYTPVIVSFYISRTVTNFFLNRPSLSLLLGGVAAYFGRGYMPQIAM